MKDYTRTHGALVFDMDGTLADTMPTHFIAWSETLRRYDIIFPEDRFYALGGVPGPHIVEMLAVEAGVRVDAAAVAEEKEVCFLERLVDLRPVEPVFAIAEAHRGRLPMAIATGSPRWMAERTLDALSVRDWFGAVVTADCVTEPKPAPEVYLRAAEGLGVAPERCQAFEDTDLGLRAARAAGMDALDVRELLRVRS